MFSTCVALSVSIDKGHKYDTMSVLGFYPAVPVVDTKHRAAISLRILKEKALLCQLNVQYLPVFMLTECLPFVFLRCLPCFISWDITFPFVIIFIWA